MKRKRLTENTGKGYYIVYNTQAVIKKLGEYEDEEEQDMIVHLPCKLYDTVYWVPNFLEWHIIEATVTGFAIHGEDRLRLILPDIDMEPIFPHPNLFLTREEAEKAIEMRIGKRDENVSIFANNKGIIEGLQRFALESSDSGNNELTYLLHKAINALSEK